MAAVYRQLISCVVALAMTVAMTPASVSVRADDLADDASEPCESAVEPECPATLDVWIVSTRHLPDICSLPSSAKLGIHRLVGEPCCRRWERAGLPELVSEPSRPFVVFIHGNRYSLADAKAQGLALARHMSRHACGGVPPRVVIFSWPSEKEGILLKDGRRKYKRACADGHYLAWLLCQLEPEQPVAIMGYSFGAMVAAEALKDLSRTSPDGIPWAERPGKVKLVFVNPALRFDAFAPSGPYRSALAGVDCFTLFMNSRDRALRFFPLLEPGVRVDAMGYVGIPRRWLPADMEYSAIDATGIVGNVHTMWRYLDSQSLCDQLSIAATDGMTD